MPVQWNALRVLNVSHMAMKNPLFQDAFPTEHGNSPASHIS